MSTLGDMNINATDEPKRAGALREKMIGDLRELGVIHSESVATAVGTVPRHLFAPEESVEQAYAVKTVLQTKRDGRGVPVSMISAVDIQALMLEQAQLGPGMRVLEIGSGGYNAALIADLVGATGEVTTVDIDSEVVDRMRRCLAVAGYDRVNVVLADADGGVPEHAPYDCVIATTSAWDIPPAWVDQLTAEGSGGGAIAAARPDQVSCVRTVRRPAGELGVRGVQLRPGAGRGHPGRAGDPAARRGGRPAGRRKRAGERRLPSGRVVRAAGHRLIRRHRPGRTV